MPSKEQFIQIYKAADKVKLVAEIATAACAGNRTVERALQLRQELEKGLDVQREKSKTGWGTSTVIKALEALKILQAERDEASWRPGRVPRARAIRGGRAGCGFGEPRRGSRR